MPKSNYLDVRAALFREDGTLKYLSYARASGKRNAVLMVSCRVKGLPQVATAFIVDGRDFRQVYEQAVRHLAKGFGSESDRKLIGDMIATCDAFLQKQSLKLVPVCYEQVIKVD